MNNTIYLLDTNVLINWAATVFPGLQEQFPNRNIDVATRNIAFFENNQNDIFIPDIVWTEFLSVIMHKEIDTSVDVTCTRKWMRDRETYVMQLETMIEELPHMHWFVWNGNGSPYPDAAEVLLDTRLVNASTFRWMSRYGKAGSAKLLDGMDSVILIYLNELALQNRDKKIVLYSADFPLCFILPRIRNLNKNWFAKHTAAFCALFDSVRCRRCKTANALKILEHNKIVCQKCGKWPLF